MAQRLTNDELAERTRVANRRRGQRMRERLVDAGRCPLTVWVPVGLRSRFVNEAAGLGVNINELAERYLDAGLRDGNYNRERNLPDPDMNHGSNLHRSVNMPDPDPYQNHGSDMPDPETAGPCDAEKLSTGLETADKSYPQAKCSDNAPVDKSGLERRIMELHRQGLSSREVARQAGCGKTKVLKTIGLNQ